MHELGIAESIAAAVRDELARHAGGRATRIGLRIGPWAGVERDSLDFCFQAVVRNTDLDGVSLHIETGAEAELEFAYLELEEPEP